MADKTEIGLFLAKLRKEKKMTQAELAEQLHVSNKTVSRWETGVVMPDYTDMTALCSIYGIEIQELFAGKRMEKASPAETGPQEKAEHASDHLISSEQELKPSEDGSSGDLKKRRLLIPLILLSIACLGLTVLCIIMIVRNSTQSTAVQKPDTTTVDEGKIADGFPNDALIADQIPDALGKISEQENFSSHKTGKTEYAVSHSNGGQEEGTVIRSVELPEEIAQRKLTDQELLNLNDASPDALRKQIETVADMINWFLLNNPKIIDSNLNVEKKNELYSFLTPAEQLTNGWFSADSISVCAAWLIEDDYEGLGVLYVNGKNCMSTTYVAVPLKDGWFVFDMAAFTVHGSENGALDCTVVRELSDVYRYLDDFNMRHREHLDSLAMIVELNDPIYIFEDAESKHLHERTQFTEITR